MTGIVVRRWSAWARGLEEREDWERWRHAPAPLESGGSPEARFLPPLLRRRCSRLSRMMLHVAFDAAGPDAVSELPTVFASRYGEMTTTVSLLEHLARREPLTAGAFSHSVHNTQAGLFSIAAKNPRMSAAVAAGSATFPCAFIEATTTVERHADGHALLVIGDEPLPPALATFSEESDAAYALALVVARDGDGPRVELQSCEPSAATASPRWPHAIEFLRWMLSDEPALTVRTGERGWRWIRA